MRMERFPFRFFIISTHTNIFVSSRDKIVRNCTFDFGLEDEGESIQKCKQINDLGKPVNSAFTPSGNALTALNKAWRMLGFIK